MRINLASGDYIPVSLSKLDIPSNFLARDGKLEVRDSVIIDARVVSLPSRFSILRGDNHRERCLMVSITHDKARYELIHEGKPLALRHQDERLTIEYGKPVERGWSVPDPGPEPSQPPGREPRKRRPR